MEQNPYCYDCRNSLCISEQVDKDGTHKFMGCCDKCRRIFPLNTQDTNNYLHNLKCKTICQCGGTAYVHKGEDFYDCLCCGTQIPLTHATRAYLQIKAIKN